jgi:hypothetical protein
MDGPFPVEKASEVVKEHRVGVFILSRDRRAFHFIGRADWDLRDSISETAREGGFTQFWFAYAESPAEAFMDECLLWHRFLPPYSQDHPAVPPGLDCKCPSNGCRRR